MMVTTSMHLSIDRHIVRSRAHRIALVLVVGLLHCAGVARAEMLTIYVDGIDFTRSAVHSEANFGGAVGAVLGLAVGAWLFSMGGFGSGPADALKVFVSDRAMGPAVT